MDGKLQNKDKDNKDAQSGQPVQLDKEQQGGKPGQQQGGKPGQQHGGQHQGEQHQGDQHMPNREQHMPNREQQQGGKQR